MADIFSDIGKTITAPIGGLIQGAMKGLAPGAVQQAERQADTVKRQKDMQQLQLMISMMKDPGSKPQTKKAASDTARRILFSYHPEFENLGTGTMMERKDWWSGLTSPQNKGAMGTTEEGFVNPMATFGEPGEVTAPSAPVMQRRGLPSPFRVESIAGKPGETEPTITLEPTGMSQAEMLTTATGLRKEFNADPAYKNFLVIERSAKGMKLAYEKSVQDQSKDSRIASDQALAVLFQKMLDPESVVRESEYARTPEGASVLSRAKAFLPKLLRGGLDIDDDDRRELYEMADALLNAGKETINKHIDRYEKIAKSYGVNPNFIMGNIKRHKIAPSKTLPESIPIKSRIGGRKSISEMTDEELKKLAGIK